MSNYAAPIEVCKAAASRVGETLNSLDDGSALAVIADTNYEGVVRAALAYRGHGWSWATETINLTQQGAIEKGMWRFAYALPSTVMKVRAAMVHGGARLRRDDWTMQGAQVLTRCDLDLQAQVLKRVNENLWSDDFAEVIVTRLEALFLRGFLERHQEARIRDKDADDLLLLALVSDKRQMPVDSVEYNALAEAWRGRTGRRSG